MGVGNEPVLGGESGDTVVSYVLESLCVDLMISEVVDAGEYVVSALFPLAVVRD